MTRGLYSAWVLFILADGVVAVLVALKLFAEWQDTGPSRRRRDIGLLVLSVKSLGIGIEAVIWLWAGTAYIKDMPLDDAAKATLATFVLIQAVARTFAALPRYIWAMYLFRVPPFRTRPAAAPSATGGPAHEEVKKQ